MSEFKVCLTSVKEILVHPNADALEVAVVYGFNVVVKKGMYQVGDTAVLVPIDSLLPQYLEDYIFPPDSKIKLTKHRIKQIRIRKLASQGMLMNPEEVNKALELSGKSPIKFELEKDYKDVLGITKFEPPEPEFGQLKQGVKTGKKKLDNPNLKGYNGIENIKWYPELFKDGEEVYITEKLHGTSTKAGFVPKVKFTLFDKIKGFLGLPVNKFEWCYASNNVQLQNKSDYKGFYGDDIYAKALEKAEVHKKLRNGEVVYGEIIGEGIQKNYNYGLKNEHKLVLFDVMIVNEDGTNRYLDPDDFIKFCEERGFERVPELFRGPFNLAKVKELTLGDSVYCSKQKVREGVVVKPLKETQCCIGRKKLKVISEAYLDKDQTDFH